MGVYYEDMDMDSPDTESAMKTVEFPPPPVNQKVLTDSALKAAQVEVANGNGLEPEEPPKKKKKKKPKKNKNAQPSGFEDYFAEIPMTVQQAEDLNKDYSIRKPFAERMELCIQRYRTKRRWDPLRSKLFDRYLVLGGIRTGQKAYGGGLSLEGQEGGVEELDATDIAAQSAIDYVEHYATSNRNRNDWKGTPNVFDDDNEEWWVDFDYVVKALLSHVVLEVFCLHTEADILVAVKTIRNFLNYVIFHNVAPEYSSNITAALATCNLAEKELLFCNTGLMKMPGRFNVCCSALFGGHYHGLYESDEAVSWEGKHKSKNRALGIPRDGAINYYLECIANIGTPEQRAAGVENVSLVSKDLIGFEVLQVNLPQGGVEELGSIDVKAWVYEGERMPFHQLPDEGWKLWVEKRVLMYIFVRMKVVAVVYTLTNGLRYIDTVTAVYPSYYTYLEPPNQSDTNKDGDGEETDS